jgi:hypothetical protein
VQGLSLDVSEVVTLIVCDEMEDSPLGKIGRLIENEPPLLDACSERAHVTNVERPAWPGKIQPSRSRSWQLQECERRQAPFRGAP